MNKFISCDWGTSSLRLRLVETETQNVLAEVISNQGIAAIYALWKNNLSDRFEFYRSILSEGIKTISAQCGYNLNHITLVISGMASSGIGMIELEYKTLPVNTNGSDLLVHTIEPVNDFKHRMIIVSGIKSSGDVMRGEETIIVGCEIKNTDNKQLFILPGTHSKHIIVKNGMITDFKTFMTGELFNLLSTKSILSGSVERVNPTAKGINSFFETGVKEGAYNNLLNSIFTVRTNVLFNKLSQNENYYYLSGLLIGTELKDISHNHYSNLTIVSNEKLLRLYSRALHILKINKGIHCITADKALIKAQSVIYNLWLLQ
ncbi:MAG TPA: 2-dehydro-3-deoxygalactonokinase [Hanamia sp.]|nr:2-dehydro-3-deoxygalactonokinase [Hanamia sp.]